MAIHCCDGATAVCDDGVPLPAERRKLDSCGLALAGAAGALAHPLVAGGSLLLQTTGKRHQWQLCTERHLRCGLFSSSYQSF